MIFPENKGKDYFPNEDEQGRNSDTAQNYYFMNL